MAHDADSVSYRFQRHDGYWAVPGHTWTFDFERATTFPGRSTIHGSIPAAWHGNIARDPTVFGRVCGVWGRENRPEGPFRTKEVDTPVLQDESYERALE